MKNLVLVFCAVIALLSFGSCQKCLNCIKAAKECGYCEGGVENQIQNNVTSCKSGQTSANEYDDSKVKCQLDAGTWKSSSNPKYEQEVCGNTSSEAQDKATPYELDGYTCK